MRVTDDSAFSTRESFLDDFANIVGKIRMNTDAPMVVGGGGFSVMPELVLNLPGADIGVWGDGEFAFVKLADRMEEDRGWLKCRI